MNMFKKTLFRQACLYGCIAIILGCSSATTLKNSPKIDYVKVWHDQMISLEVTEAFYGKGQLYIRYMIQLNQSDRNKEFFATTCWIEEDIDLKSFPILSAELEFIGEKEWRSRSKGMKEISIVSSEEWDKVRDTFVETVTPQKKNTASVVRNDDQELLFYYDENGVIVVEDIADKPVGISIERVYNLQEVSEITKQSLEIYLQELNDDKKMFLFVVNNDEGTIRPFMFFDVLNKQVVSLGTRGDDVCRVKGKVVQKGIKTADQMILDSHVLGVPNRPFTSAMKLFSWGKGTVLDIVSTTKIRKISNKVVPPIVDSFGMDLDKFEKRLDKVIKSKRTYGKIDFLIGGDQYFPRLIEALIDAKESIYLRTFIFDNDDYAVKVADVLKKKSLEKGVSVKVLLDGMGQIMGEGKDAEDIPVGFKSPASMEDYLKQESNVEVRVRPNAWFKADHTKTTTIDNKISFTGGMNIGREYRYHWHDLMVELEGPIVEEILYEFNIAWAHSSKLGDLALIREIMSSKKVRKKIIDPGEYYAIRPLYTRINDSQIFKAQLEAIKNAKKYIYINNAYFSDNTILYELIRARSRGVDVRVVLPVSGNHEIMNASNVVTANKMFKNGIRVYFYPGMSHIKAAIYDGWLCTGSANFDKLSFRYNLEFNLATSHKETVEILKEQLFEIDFEKSKEMKGLLKSNLKNFVSEILAEQL